MKISPPFCFARFARRSLFCTLLIVCGGALGADLSGYWQLDLKRSELAIDPSALTPIARQRQQAFDPLKHDPVSVCMPYAMPRVMTAAGAYPMEIVQTDRQVTLIFDAHDEVRRIFLDRTAPATTDLAPLWLGYAYGKWDGPTLVVQTIGVTDQSLLDATGIPHTDQLRIVERLRRVDANTLLDEMTLHDAEALTRPIVRKLYFVRTVSAQPREFHCAEQQWLDHVMNRAKELTRELAGKKP